MRRYWPALISLVVLLSPARAWAADDGRGGLARMYPESAPDGSAQIVGAWQDGTFTQLLRSYPEVEPDGTVTIYQWTDGSYTCVRGEYTEQQADGLYTVQLGCDGTVASWPAPPPIATASACNTDVDRLFRTFRIGIGPEADQAARSDLARNAPLGILSSWFNKSQDLQFFDGWRRSGQLNDWWNRGYVLHIVTYEGEPPGISNYRPYHISPQFVSDMQALARIISAPADGKHVVLFSLATEFQTYMQPHNQYNQQTAWYYDALKA
ncbi:MAG TPA: hypothetical protein VGK54_18250, partial [Chloroflexota bacterium]